MRHRIITVPKDKVVENALDFDEATPEQLIELQIKEEEFLFLYKNGIIEMINQEGNTNIDDFEDDSVTGKENLGKVIKALNLKDKLSNNPQYHLIQTLSNLFIEAQDRNTGVYFYF